MPPKPRAASPTASPPPQGAAGGPAKKPRKRPMELGDVPNLDGVQPFDSSEVGIPELSEARILELTSALQMLEGEPAPDVSVSDAPELPAAQPPVQTSDALLLELLGTGRGTATKGAKRQLASQQFSATARTELALTLRALYRRIHASGLRAHEEVAAHLGVNIGDVIQTEQLFELPGIGVVAARRLAKAADGTPSDVTPSTGAIEITPAQGSPYQRATAGLPPLAVMLLRYWTTDSETLRRYFTHKPSNVALGSSSDVTPLKVARSPAAGSAKTGAVDDEEAALRRKALVDHLRALLRQRDTGVPQLGEHDLHVEVARALHVRDRDALCRWAGTAAVLVAAIDHIHTNLLEQLPAATRAAVECPPTVPLQHQNSTVGRAASPLGASSKGSPAKNKGKSPDKSISMRARNSASNLDASAEPAGPPSVYFVHTLRYRDGEQARVAMERAIAALEPGSSIDAPLLLPFRVTTAEPQLQPLPRVEGFVEEPLDTAGDGKPRTKADRARVLCDGYDRTEPWASRITIVITGPVEAVVPLSAFGFAAMAPSTQSRQPSHAASAFASVTGLVDEDTVSVASGSASAAGTAQSVTSRRPPGLMALRRADPASRAQSLSPAVFPQRSTLKFEAFDAAEQKLTFRVGAARKATDNGDLTLFLESVLADAFKADQVANKIHNRLALRFVRPHHCKRHTSQKHAFFCKTCRVLICRACRSERHAHHDSQPLPGFCADEELRLRPKREVVTRRLEALHRIRDELTSDEGRMHAVVDAAIDDVSERLDARSAELHADVTARTEQFQQDVAAELAGWREERETLASALEIISAARSGRVEHISATKWREPATIKNGFEALRLPTKELKLLASVLTWSNASQYLTNAIYPPPEDPTMAPHNAATAGSGPGGLNGSSTGPSSPRAGDSHVLRE